MQLSKQLLGEIVGRLKLSKRELQLIDKLMMLVDTREHTRQFDTMLNQDYVINKELIAQMREIAKNLDANSTLIKFKTILHDPELFPSADIYSNGTSLFMPDWMKKIIDQLLHHLSDLVVPIIKEIISDVLLPGFGTMFSSLAGEMSNAIRYEADTVKNVIEKQIHTFESKIKDQIDMIKQTTEQKIKSAENLVQQKIDTMKKNFDTATQTIVNITNQTTTWAEQQVFGSQAWNVSKWFPEFRNTTSQAELYSWWNPFDGVINTILDGCAKLIQLVMKVIVADLIAPLIAKIIDVLVTTFALEVELWYPVWIMIINFVVCMLISIVYVLDKTVKLFEILGIFIVIVKYTRLRLIPSLIVTSAIALLIGVVRPQGYPSILCTYLEVYGTTIRNCSLPNLKNY